MPRRRRARTFRRSSAALVSGAALPASLREELAARGVAVLQCYATADLGVIAYESEAREGMIVNETLMVEIVRPGTGDPVADGRGRRGRRHLVQSGLSDDPARHRRPLGGDAGQVSLRAHQHADQGLDGPRRSDHQGQGHVRAIPRRWRRSASAIPSSDALRLAVTRADEQDVMTLSRRMRVAGRRPAGGRRRYACNPSPSSGARCELVAPGSLPNDGKVIADERPVG